MPAGGHSTAGVEKVRGLGVDTAGCTPPPLLHRDGVLPEGQREGLLQPLLGLGASGTVARGGWPPKCHTPSETPLCLSLWDLCCWFESKQQMGWVWHRGTNSPHKTGCVRLPLLVNALYRARQS